MQRGKVIGSVIVVVHKKLPDLDLYASQRVLARITMSLIAKNWLIFASNRATNGTNRAFSLLRLHLACKEPEAMCFRENDAQAKLLSTSLLRKRPRIKHVSADFRGNEAQAKAAKRHSADYRKKEAQAKAVD